MKQVMYSTKRRQHVYLTKDRPKSRVQNWMYRFFSFGTNPSSPHENLKEGKIER